MSAIAPLSQAVHNSTTRHAIFMVATLNAGAAAAETVRGWCEDVAALVRTVGTRAPQENLSCVCAFGSSAWDTLFGAPRPAALHPFREFGAGQRLAAATPGDILLHIRADSMDLCFELATLLRNGLGDAVTVVDEVHGFRYFDRRAIIGFVDGTENPEGREAVDFTVIGDEDAGFAGGSYVLVQKYLHDMAAWNSLTVESQEGIIGRHKVSNVELDDDIKPSSSHSSLTTLEENGEEVKILRDNMPFGRPGQGEYGTYFIGYSRHLWVTQKMLERMFLGDPPGMHDRLLDFSTAHTGAVFFAPAPRTLSELVEAVQA